jgi:LysR family transcriptional regulator, nitrogen assimilation regulatory protein
MDFRQIKYFIAIAEHGSLSAASDVIHIAQPALSTQTSNLESELGVMLFNRHGRGVTLTPAGKIFLKHAYRIREEITAAKSAVMNISADCAGIVYLGLPMTTSTVFAVPIIEHVRKAYPLIDLRIVDGMSADVCSWLLEGRLDVAVLYEAHHSIAKSAMPLLEDELSGSRGPNSKVSMRSSLRTWLSFRRSHPLDRTPCGDCSTRPPFASAPTSTTCT